MASAAPALAKRIDLPSGMSAYETIPVKAMDDLVAQSIRPGDTLSIRVFGEPELSKDDYVVDTSGFVQVPLAGQVIAGGASPEDLRIELARRLGARYIRDPQVSVTVSERAKSNFAVEGQVEEPGVYEADVSTTLLAAIARAKSPTRTAKLDEVLVFRNLDGRRMGARFDLNDVRAGRVPDPQIIGGDTVVVGYSGAKGFWRDVRETAPLLNLFYIFK
ncbi:polysaccharide biosynthesis/export family protein [Novosphingobium sp.]|uniref:polysaccharide biosynthesis/export family protein n=1 Tax=Novosphingobium sp. TaxID=1874826 RepID=UPI0027371CA2|nr:polysaccharide biosynthesis/export family protein [Novosphingobium sp.]MDP3906633.1 polysaccharide biosynthesis/export family protein [Novosphingobium sp.]